MQGRAAPARPQLIVGMDRPNASPAPRPAHLPEGLATECWDEITSVLIARDIYDEDCTHVIIAYCIQWKRFVESTERAYQLQYCEDAVKQWMQWVSISNTACLMLLKLATHIGLTPTRRHKAHKVSRLNKVANKYLNQVA